MSDKTNTEHFENQPKHADKEEKRDLRDVAEQEKRKYPK